MDKALLRIRTTHHTRHCHRENTALKPEAMEAGLSQLNSHLLQLETLGGILTPMDDLMKSETSHQPTSRPLSLSS